MSFDAAVSSELEKRIRERKAEIMFAICSGSMDAKLYDHNCGKLAGLDEALSFLEQTKADIQRA